MSATEEKLHCKKCRNNRLPAEFTENSRDYKTCNFCRHSRRQRKWTIEDCKEFAKSKNGECLSEEYKNNKTKMLWKCSENHQWMANFDSIKNNKSWCPNCAGLAPLTLNECKEYAQRKGGECLSEEYKNCMTKMKWKCSSGHEWMARFNDIKFGQWCPSCAGNFPLTIDECRRFAQSKNGECLSEEYKNNKTKLLWKCSENHVWEARFDSIKFGQWCPQCSSGMSEQLCREIFEEHYGEKFPNVRPQWLSGLELDGYCEKLGIGFEYNGKQHYEYIPHFHRNGEEEFKQQLDRDRRKYEICAKKNINLILIPYKFNCHKPDKLKIFILDAISNLTRGTDS